MSTSSFFSKNNPLPFIDLAAQQKRIRPQLDRAIQRVLDHGGYSLGPECQEFETALSNFTNVPYVMGCSDGTDALLMGLMALDVGPGDAVFVPSFTFISTAEVVVLRGATPVFVDVNSDSFNMDPHSLETAIKAVKKTSLKPKGIIAVDLFGQPAPHQEIGEIAKSHDLWVIVDGAQSLGATYQGKHTVAYGIMATTSFFPAKPLGGYGDGGAIFTADEHLYKKLYSIHIHGQGKTRYETSRLGLTGRLDTLQAAILKEKLVIFPDEIVSRNRIAQRYNEGLRSYVKVPEISSNCTSVWAQYTIQTPGRDGLKAYLQDQGVPTGVYYPIPLHQQVPYKDYPRSASGLETTEKLAQEVLSLPMHAYLTEEVQDVIIGLIKGYFEEKG